MTELMKTDIEDTSKDYLVSDDLKSQVELFIASIIDRAKNDPNFSSFYAGGLSGVIYSHVDALVNQIGSRGESRVFVAYLNMAGNATVSETRQDSGTVGEALLEVESVGLQIGDFLTASKEVTFEEGLGTDFYRELESLIKQYGKDAILALYYRIMTSKQFDPEVAAETLNWLGTIDCPDMDTYHLRLWLLVESLKHSSPWVREGATIGLSRLGDPEAISCLKSVSEKEKRPLLRKLMKNTITRLRQTNDAAVSQGHNQPL